MTGTVVDYKEVYELLLQETKETKSDVKEVLEIQTSECRLLKELNTIKGITTTDFVDPFVAEQIAVVSKNALLAIAIQYEQQLSLKKEFLSRVCHKTWLLTRETIHKQLNEEAEFVSDNLMTTLDCLRERLIGLKTATSMEPFGDLNQVYLALPTIMKLVDRLKHLLADMDHYEDKWIIANDIEGVLRLSLDMQITENILSSGIREVRLCA